MRGKSAVKRLGIHAAAAILAFSIAFASTTGDGVKYSKDGGLPLPDYSKWVFVGSSLGLAYTDQGRENPPFTNVFAEPRAYDQFVKNGVWPDKTVLIGEFRASVTNLSINKTGHAQTGKPIAVEAEVKDKSRGGWTFYGFPGDSTVGTAFPHTAECYSCHEQHAAVDNTFVQFYPKLIEFAKQKGTYKDR